MAYSHDNAFRPRINLLYMRRAAKTFNAHNLQQAINLFREGTKTINEFRRQRVTLCVVRYIRDTAVSRKTQVEILDIVLGRRQH